MFKSISIKGKNEPRVFYYDMGDNGIARVDMKPVESTPDRYQLEVQASVVDRKGEPVIESDGQQIVGRKETFVIATAGLGDIATLHPMWIRAPKAKRTDCPEVMTTLPESGEHGDLVWVQPDENSDGQAYKFDRGALESMRQHVVKNLDGLVTVKHAPAPAQELGL